MRTEQKILIVAAAAVVLIVVGITFFRDEGVPETLPIVTPGAALSSAAGAGVTGSPVEGGSLQDATVDYFPLSDGYRRNYLVEVSFRDEAMRFGIAKLEVVGRETIRGNEYFKVVLRITGIPEMSELVVRYCRKTADAWVELDERQKENSAFETVSLPLPPRAQLPWDRETPEERSNWVVEGTRAVELSGKKYENCLRIAYERRVKEEPDYFESGHYFLAPDVGLIQQVAVASGTRITYTLDERAPAAVDFFATWSGRYKAVSRGGMTGGDLQLYANGRYRMIRSWADSAVDAGSYEPNPARDGEMTLRDDSGPVTVYRFRRSEEAAGATLYVSPAGGDDLLGEEYVRAAPGP
jgi:hypothetical protein